MKYKSIFYKNTRPSLKRMAMILGVFITCQIFYANDFSTKQQKGELILYRPSALFEYANPVKIVINQQLEIYLEMEEFIQLTLDEGEYLIYVKTDNDTVTSTKLWSNAILVTVHAGTVQYLKLEPKKFRYWEGIIGNESPDLTSFIESQRYRSLW